ncbi:interleukin-20 receptor subunit alpha-like [Chrysemys picta bellii]|uniref:Fibronectin type-III domain-containing protein n=1 Tax=Chrysemys picta bellii TaxID=8478 RepID=A0A8C3FFS7_CHRPI|nr:interleukin-20 receptor subunit alpha-like [Chrysemys picta bellii]
MPVVLSVLLLLFHQTLLLGMLSPPQNVTLTSENFHILLVWEPGSGSGNGTQYEVQSCQRSSNWTKVDTCWRNSTRSSHTCKLHFEDIHKMYWARVRAMDGAQMSEWAISNELQPYRDTIVGPPILTLMLVNENLTVILSMPLTPYRRRNGTYKSVQKVLLNWKYRISLSEKGVHINNVSFQPEGKITSHTFEYLKPNTDYCVTARVVRQQSKVSVQCIKTPDSPADFLWDLVLVLVALFMLLLLSAVCFYFLKLYMYSSISKMPFPKTLAILNEELNVNLWNKSLAHDLEGASITLISVAGLASNGNSPVEQERLQIQLLPEDCQAWKEEGYCANGFGPGYCENVVSSSSSGQLEFAGTVDSEAPLSSAGQMKDGYAGEGNYRTALEAQLPMGQLVFSEQLPPVSAALARDGYMSDRDYRPCSEIQIPLHLQVYCKCSSPVSETCSVSPPTCSLRDLKKNTDGKSRGWPPMDWVDIPLSSVKLQVNEETQNYLAPFPRHLYSHTADKTMKDSKADLSRLGQSDVEQHEYLPVSQEQHGLPEHTELSDDPSGEPYPKTDDTKITTFYSYELRPQVLVL